MYMQNRILQGHELNLNEVRGRVNLSKCVNHETKLHRPQPIQAATMKLVENRRERGPQNNTNPAKQKVWTCNGRTRLMKVWRDDPPKQYRCQ